MRLLFLSTAIALAMAAPASADDELVVTAKRLPALITETPDARVIDQGEIELRQAVFAADVLSTAPGVSVSRNGGFGGVTSVRMRGASADKTLVLIDGVVQNDASQPAGGYDFAGLDLADIERIEVLSGPQGSLWGSDAIGGVIALTTREQDGWRASLEGGSFGTARGSAALGARTDDWALNASLSGYRSDGISKADGFPEKDGFRTWTAGLGGRLRLSDAVSLDGRLRYSDSHVDTDGYAPPFFTFGDTAEFATSRAWTGYARATVDGPWGLSNSFTFAATDLKRANLGGDFPSRFSAVRRDYRWMAHRGAPEDRFGIAFGAERDETSASLSTSETQDLGDTSVFVAAHVRPLKRISLTGSVRYDDPDSFASRTTARIGAVAELGWGFSLTGDWGQGFKIPTISETACDFCFPPGPSVGLRPERAEGWDMGVRWRSGDGRVLASVSGFRLAVRDQISYGVGRYVNIDRTLSTGVEADLEARLSERLTLKANYAYTDAVDRSTGARLLRVPEHAGSASLMWNGARWSGALTVRAEGEQADSDPSTFLPAIRKGFVLADLAGGYRVTEKVEITARVENLADRHYQEALGYGEPGRAVYVGVRLRE
ncbi:MAG TPA: TonB-dependent receptor [Caulobacteraceae bacterium]|nr:TonB-dependent receptor [Caulobacteraceae bacterium]